MKILELNFEKTWRGGERQTYYNIVGFLEGNHEVGIICRKGFPLENALQKTQAKVYSFSNVFQVFWYLCLHARKYDVIHAQTAHILTYCLLSKPFHKRRIFFSRRVDFLPKGFFTRIKYLKTDKIIAVSRAVQQTVTQFCKRKDIEVISDVALPKELDAKSAKKILVSYNIPPSKIIIGTIAALDQHKDPLTTIMAINELKKTRDDFVVLHFGDGVLSEICAARIKELHLENTYYLVGFRDNIEDYFSLFNVFVLSSIKEGLGSSILDAYLYKVPVVGTAAGGITELLEKGGGIACKPHDYHGFSAAINELLNENKTAQKQRTAEAYNYVMAAHSISAISEQYIRLFNYQ